MKTNGNEMAFPDPILGSTVSSTEGIDTGLTKREYFAAMAMQGFLASTHLVPNRDGYEYSARVAVAAADALIEALNKEATHE